MRTPPIPQMTVSQNGMLSRSPGATNLPSRPMIVPPISAQRIAPITDATFAPEGRGVGEGEDTAGRDRFVDRTGDVLGRLVALDDELTGGVQDADLDLHGCSLLQALRRVVRSSVPTRWSGTPPGRLCRSVLVGEGIAADAAPGQPGH